MNFPKEVEIAEVGPRDGFQNIGEFIPTAAKLEIIDSLVECGFKNIEITSFVNPKAVPQMADAKDVVQACRAKHPSVAFSALTPNLRGVQNALEAGADNLVYIVSASERHNMENTRQTIDQSLEGLAEVCKVKGAASLQLAIPTVFNCPWTGKVPPESTIRIIERGLALGVSSFGIADTVGDANPLHVKELLDILKARFPELDIGLHLHDTYGMALASILMALESGVRRFESAIGGLGGCPFAPGAAGNVSTEDLVNMLHGMGIKTGIDQAKVMAASAKAKSLLPVPLNSRVALAQSCAKHLAP